MELRAVSGMMLTLFVFSMLTLAFNTQPVRAIGVVIRIKADGSVDPPTAPISSVDNVTYTFTGNINDYIIVGTTLRESFLDERGKTKGDSVAI